MSEATSQSMFHYKATRPDVPPALTGTATVGLEAETLPRGGERGRGQSGNGSDGSGTHLDGLLVGIKIYLGFSMDFLVLRHKSE